MIEIMSFLEFTKLYCIVLYCICIFRLHAIYKLVLILTLQCIIEGGPRPFSWENKGHLGGGMSILYLLLRKGKGKR